MDLILCSLHFIANLFTNKAQFHTGFSGRLKLKEDAVLIESESDHLTVMSHHTNVSNCLYYVVTLSASICEERMRSNILKC